MGEFKDTLFCMGTAERSLGESKTRTIFYHILQTVEKKAAEKDRIMD